MRWNLWRAGSVMSVVILAVAGGMSLLRAEPMPAGEIAGSAKGLAKPISELAWLAGSWSGEHDGGTIEEHWMAPAGGTMSGMNRLVMGGKTAFHEYLRLKQNADGTIDYLAQPVGRCPPTPFRLTELSATKAVFENPTHDDPKLIRYELASDGSLTATTEGQKPDGTKTAHSTTMKPGKLR